MEMDIDIRINGKSCSVEVENPHRPDMQAIMKEIASFARKNNADLGVYELDKLIPLMIRGVAGCEAGCPSDAMGVARRGFGNFRIEYVEGGILKAAQELDNGDPLEIKIFPDFE
jgi:hypothetical protein